MLAKRNRIVKESDFTRIYRTARPRFSHFFSLRYAKNGGFPCRIGIVVSQKVDKASVRRNRLKRQVREILDDILPLLPSEIDLILSLTPAAKQASFQELQRDLHLLFHSCRLLPHSSHPL